ncbi:glycosyltransferase family 4 protein, partial [Enterobacter hormaechei subsp. steigerwaltii]|nr:glycosyltransferase family 4 protein [Enterobacter hormaechei subsp. steigerwaltii]
GPYKQQLELDFGECDNVYFSTFRPEDSLDFHKNKDIAIVCSIGSEGTSLSLLEGMAAGCAVVSTNVGGLTNIVIDQHNGLLCEPNADSLYGALISLIDDEIKRKKLALNAYNTVIDSFNITKWRREWSDMLLFVENKS